MNSRKIILSIGSIILLVVGLVYYWGYVKEKELIVQGNAIIKKVEAYKKINHKLPIYLEQLGIKDDGPLYYTTRDSINYIVWYGTTLGESVSYHSEIGKWQEGN